VLDRTDSMLVVVDEAIAAIRSLTERHGPPPLRL
jgi:hypothetical protein